MTTEKLYDIFKQYPVITTDSRKCAKDALFFALRGENFDGNKFALQALENGCKYAVVDDPSLEKNPSCIYVRDTLKALQQLALYHRKMFKIPVIGITGTNGKTTTKELTAAVLSSKFKVWYTKGNFNNHIGVPLTLLEMPENTEIAIIEMGANHKGEIDFLCNIALPNFGLITNVGKAHLEGFGSFEGVMETKSELYRFIEKNGIINFLNFDNSFLKTMMGEGKYLSYGASKIACIIGQNVKAEPFLEFEWCDKSVKTWHKVKTNLTGIYNFENALAAICIASHFKVPEQLINNALSEYIPQNHRSQLINTKHNKVIIDAYNANPDSMKVALYSFDKMENPHKVLIIGEMKELGKDSYKEHEVILEQIKTMNVDECFLTGDEFKHFQPLPENCKWFESANHISDYLKIYPLFDKLILIKGSRPNKLEVLLDCLQ